MGTTTYFIFLFVCLFVFRFSFVVVVVVVVVVLYFKISILSDKKKTYLKVSIHYRRYSMDGIEDLTKEIMNAYSPPQDLVDWWEGN